MSGLKRYMVVLHKFDEAHPKWTVQELAEALDAPASTIYRIVRDLVAHGLLARASDAQYRLGTAFIEFDRILRLTDPLARLGRNALSDIVNHASVPCVGLLCSLYDDHVMCIADERAGLAEFQPSYERGRPMPLTRGATSQVILSELPSRRVQKLLGSAAEQTADLRRRLASIRKQGYCVSRGEIDEGLVGIAAPIVSPSTRTIGSLSLVVAAKDVSDAIERRLIMLVVSSASVLSNAMEKSAETK